MVRAPQSHAGRQDVVRALRQLGVAVTDSADGLRVAVGDGPTVLVRPVWRSVLSAGRAQDALRAVQDGGPGTPMVIADKIPAPARDVLNAAGVGWFDRRGHLRLTGPGLLVDADVPAPQMATARPAFPSGRTGVGTAVALLVARAAAAEPVAWETVAPNVTEIAALAGVAVSGASTAMKTFRQLGYLNGDGSPVVPDLFWATVEHWSPQWVSLGKPIDSDPRLAKRLDANLEHLDRLGWCLAGDGAAAAWRAPIVGGDVGARQWYVPSLDVLDTLRWTLGEPSAGEPAADYVAVAPTPVACRRRVDRGVGAPVEPLAAAALDLSLDQARGQESLEQWVPETGQRVW
jgi:hypothetical protein